MVTTSPIGIAQIGCKAAPILSFALLNVLNTKVFLKEGKHVKRHFF